MTHDAHTEAKHRILGRYLAAYFPIMARQFSTQGLCFVTRSPAQASTPTAGRVFQSSRSAPHPAPRSSARAARWTSCSSRTTRDVPLIWSDSSPAGHLSPSPRPMGSVSSFLSRRLPNLACGAGHCSSTSTAGESTPPTPWSSGSGSPSVPRSLSRSVPSGSPASPIRSTSEPVTGFSEIEGGAPSPSNRLRTRGGSCRRVPKALGRMRIRLPVDVRVDRRGRPLPLLGVRDFECQGR